MQELVFIIHIIVSACLVGLVLMQHGKGADMGAGFGSGASNTIFGSSGSIPFLLKVTALAAAIFFATSVILGVMVAHQVKQREVAPPTSVPLMPPVDKPTDNR